MDGIVFDVDDDTFARPHHERLTLRPHGVVLLAKCGLLPNIKADDIKDKSKSDGLEKTIVILQATWMLVQVLSRVIVSLPVSLLEVNTIAHVFCAFIVYLHGEDRDKKGMLPNRVAAMPEMTQHDYMECLLSTQLGSRSLRTADSSYTLAENVINLEPFEGLPIMDSLGQPCEKGNEIGKHVFTAHTAEEKARDCGIFVRRLDMPVSDVAGEPDPTFEKRQRLACRAFENFAEVRRLSTQISSVDKDCPIRYSAPAAQFIVPYAPNWPGDYLLPGLQGEVMGMCLWFASMAYGGIHLAAWHDYFPSEIETILWRVSAIYISSSGFFWFALNIFAHLSPWASAWWDRFYALKAHPLQYVLLGSGATLCGISYILARIFLVVDGIVSLRSSPPDMYHTTDWSIFVPHL